MWYATEALYSEAPRTNDDVVHISHDPLRHLNFAKSKKSSVNRGRFENACASIVHCAQSHKPKKKARMIWAIVVPSTEQTRLGITYRWRESYVRFLRWNAEYWHDRLRMILWTDRRNPTSSNFWGIVRVGPKSIVARQPPPKCFSIFSGQNHLQDRRCSNVVMG